MNIKYVFFDCWDTLIKYNAVEGKSLLDIIKPHITNIAELDYERVKSDIQELEHKYFSPVKYYELSFATLLHSEADLFNLKLDFDVTTKEGYEFIEDELLDKFYRPMPTTNVLNFLKYAKKRGIKLNIISNTIFSSNFTRKAIMKTYGWTLDEFNYYFDSIIVSSEAGFKKPNSDFFKLGMSIAGCLDPRTSMYIGDSPFADIFGSASAQMNPCHINFKNNATRELKQFKNLFSFEDYQSLINFFERDEDYIVELPKNLKYKVKENVY